LAVLENGFRMEVFLERDVRNDFAGVKDWPGDRGREKEVARLPVENIFDIGGVQPDRAGEGEFGKKVCGGGADVGVGRGDLAESLADVGAPKQEVGRQAD